MAASTAAPGAASIPDVQSSWRIPVTRIAPPAIVIALVLYGCADLPRVQGGNVVEYRCAGGETALARYYQLADDSLHFVRLEISGTTYALPQVMSGSGARYTDERDLVWWIKGDSARLSRRDAAGRWTEAVTCTATTSP